MREDDETGSAVAKHKNMTEKELTFFTNASDCYTGLLSTHYQIRMMLCHCFNACLKSIIGCWLLVVGCWFVNVTTGSSQPGFFSH